jgi:Flp pilus assembly protein TadD
MEQGNYKRAESVCRKAIEKIPDDPVLHLLLADLLRARGMFLEANVEQQKAASLDPNLVPPENP